MQCPECKKEIDDKVIASYLASKGGKASSKMSKTKLRARAKLAAKARWAKSTI